MKGIIIGGLGEGKKFMGMDEYRIQFKEKLGINVFPGTLNIITDCDKIFKEMDGIIIPGFKKGEIEYGGVKCFPVMVNGEKAAIIIPEKTKHNNLEIIAEFNIRKKFRLKDGDEIEINFQPFVKLRRKYILDCIEGYEKAKIRIYYESPLIKNPMMEGCEERKNDRILPSRYVASLIFEDDWKKNYKKLMEWIKKRYSIMSYPVLIDYGKLKEWQIEIKWNKN